jgi:hypothetical protein
MRFTGTLFSAVTLVTLNVEQTFATPMARVNYTANTTIPVLATNLSSDAITQSIRPSAFRFPNYNATLPPDVASLDTNLRISSSGDLRSHLRTTIAANVATISKNAYAISAARYRMKPMIADLDYQMGKDCYNFWTNVNPPTYDDLEPACRELSHLFRGVYYSIATTDDFERNALEPMLDDIIRMSRLWFTVTAGKSLILDRLIYFWIRWIPAPRSWKDLEDFLASQPDASKRDAAFKKTAETLRARIAEQRIFPVAVTNIFDIWIGASLREPEYSLEGYKEYKDRKPETAETEGENHAWKVYKEETIDGDRTKYGRDHVAREYWQKATDTRKKEERKNLKGEDKKFPPMRWTCVSGAIPECCLSWEGVCTNTYEWDYSKAAKCKKTKSCVVRN